MLLLFPQGPPFLPPALRFPSGEAGRLCKAPLPARVRSTPCAPSWLAEVLEALGTQVSKFLPQCHRATSTDPVAQGTRARTHRHTQSMFENLPRVETDIQLLCEPWHFIGIRSYFSERKAGVQRPTQSHRTRKMPAGQGKHCPSLGFSDVRVSHRSRGQLSTQTHSLSSTHRRHRSSRWLLSLMKPQVSYR